MPSSNSLSSLDVFIGFLYATTIGLVLKTGYLNSGIDTVRASLILLALLFFYALDWLARYYPLRTIEELKDELKSGLLVRRLIDVALVFFLLVSSLKCVEIYLTHNLPNNALSVQVMLYSIGAFAIASWFWNLVTVWIRKPLRLAKLLLSLLAGRLPSALLDEFPGMKNAWEELEGYYARASQVRNSEEVLTSGLIQATAEKLKSENTSATLKEHRQQGKAIAKASARELRLISCFAICRLFFLYFVFVHVLALTGVVAGFIIYASRYGNWYEPFVLSNLSGVAITLLAIIIIVVAGIMFYCFFISAMKQRVYELLGVYFLLASFLFFYALSPTWCLIVLLLLQHVSANVIMLTFYQPTSSNLQMPLSEVST